jgi:hypothetical protein
MAPKKTTCFYKFPCHPKEMYDDSPPNLSNLSRLLRVQIIEMIANLSQSYTQEQLDTKLHVDVDEDNEIVGLDISELIGLPLNMCEGKRILLGTLTSDNWKTMKVTL